MKKLLIFCGFILSCGYVSAQQYGATYTPYSRPVDNYNYQQPILGNQRQARVQSGTRREMTVQVVKNCIALFPDNSHMTVDVHVKKISDSARSFGFVVSGTLFALPNANGLVKIGYMREIDPDIAPDYPYYVIYETRAGSILCVLPSLNIVTVNIHTLDTLDDFLNDLNRQK
ncbi:hypothetical protein [Alistipes shahii]|jgi:hypothetical protein|uniref:hypothetical protein n=1 Tax=Alistipes shahii TaxID=328814 RepID=UPI003CEB1B8D